MKRLQALLLVAVPGAAQAGDVQAWQTVQVQGPLGARAIYSADVQTKVDRGVSHLGQVQVRGAVGVRIGARLVVYQGYAHSAVPLATARGRNEERSFQQLSWAIGRVGPGELSARTRVEERWRSDGRDMQLRLRQQLRYRLPIRGSRLAAIGSVEGFGIAHAADWGPGGGVDQVRMSVGVEIPLAGASTVEAGYMAQAVNQPAGRLRVNNIGLVTLVLRR